MSAAMAKKTINGNEWTVTSINGTVSLSAELPHDTIKGMALTIEVAYVAGITTDLCADFSSPGFAMLTFQCDASQIDDLDNVLTRLAA